LSFLDNLRIRRTRGRKVASMDREATSEDLDALREFARTRVGVEFFVEPETMVTDTTAVAVAADGEWTRRRVGSPQVIRQVAKQLQLPVYDVQIVGYPERIPPLQTGVPHLVLANTTQIYPEDRGTNYAVRLGGDAAEALLSRDLNSVWSETGS